MCRDGCIIICYGCDSEIILSCYLTSRFFGWSNKFLCFQVFFPSCTGFNQCLDYFFFHFFLCHLHSIFSLSYGKFLSLSVFSSCEFIEKTNPVLICDIRNQGFVVRVNVVGIWHSIPGFWLSVCVKVVFSVLCYLLQGNDDSFDNDFETQQRQIVTHQVHILLQSINLLQVE